MPETNLLRYVLPEHFAPIISRWHVGVKKDLLIQRAVFNGTGIVVWQDIFGSWLPYNQEQKDAIRKWKQILSENSHIYLSVHPIPLYPVLKEGLSCNSFPSDCQDSVIYSLYNETDASIEGDLFLHKGHDAVETIAEIWNGIKVDMRQTVAGDAVCGSIAAKAVLVIKITSKELSAG